MTFHKAILAAAFLATSALAVNAKSTTTDTQKMEEECEARRNGQSATVDPDAVKAIKEKNEVVDAEKKADKEMTVAVLPKSADGSKDAEQANKDIVENTKSAPDGSKEVAAGPAKPVENW